MVAQTIFAYVTLHMLLSQLQNLQCILMHLRFACARLSQAICIVQTVQLMPSHHWQIPFVVTGRTSTTMPQYMQLNKHLFSNCILQTHIGSQQPTYKLHVALQQAAHPPVINMGSKWYVYKQSHWLYTAPLYIGFLYSHCHASAQHFKTIAFTPTVPQSHTR